MDLLLKGPMELEKGKQYVSGSKYHYLMWDGKDLAVYTDTGNPVWKFSDGFEVEQQVESVAISEDGQITVTAHKISREPANVRPKPRGWLYDLETHQLVKNPNRPRGTAIHLNEEGVLQVVAPTGRVVWESTAK